MITVYEFMRMFLEENEQYFVLWDINKNKKVFAGYLEDLPNEFCSVEVVSIDNLTENGIIILNIDI